MAEIVVTKEVYSPLTRVSALQADLACAPTYWPNLLSCRAASGAADPAIFTWAYRLGRRTVTGSATLEAPCRTCLIVHLDGGIRGTITAEYAATAMTRTHVTLRIDVRLHHSPFGAAVDRVFAYKQLAADQSRALDNLAELAEQETSAVLGRLVRYLDAPIDSRSGACVRILDRSGATLDVCRGPLADRTCSRAWAGLGPCAGHRVVPPDTDDAVGWALDVRPDVHDCPLGWLLPAIERSA
jgi:polyketide cyclase/dehydrase/lipid transport protein